MLKNPRLRIGLRQMRFSIIERWHDLANIFLPIFLVSGLVAGCFRFWLWVFDFASVAVCFR